MDAIDYIPQSKDDFNSIERLRQLRSEQIVPLIPQLLEWLQDQNWPIYNDIKSILIPQQLFLVKPLKQILHSNDSSWKYFILSDFLPCVDDEVLRQLQVELQMLAYSPLSIEDKLEEVDVCALELLKTRFE
ncbi:DUF5071 domain-containing protein [Paenibacillus sp. SGZ-1009]|uniref:DUF5071 domain-containing protein n=1 Tax=Paenibacillus campi TaxID=3106031 RepID=UPI002AFF51B4|nr:DUF5071 domain-containing protein [Paenibacillus sp. SGZ-1009]